MSSQLMFLDCPAYLDAEGASRCCLPAEVKCRYVQSSTDGPLESATIRCPNGHWFSGPVEYLTWEKAPVPRGAGRPPAAEGAGKGQPGR
jgi:hypothetical protein